MIPAAPQYLLRSPDRSDTPFPEILDRYNGFVPGREGMDLRPLMELRIENAYYQKGMPKRGLNGFLGTEVARYRVQPRGGLRLISVQSMENRPNDQPAVQHLIARSQIGFRDYRFYFEILFKDESRTRGSVLLAANSTGELNQLAARLLAQPDSVCGVASPHCTVFPEACSVSIEMQIVVNGAPRTVLWGSSLASVAAHPRSIQLLRRYRGSFTPVELDVRDPQALRLPLLPGDRIRISDIETETATVRVCEQIGLPRRIAVASL